MKNTILRRMIMITVCCCMAGFHCQESCRVFRRFPDAVQKLCAHPIFLDWAVWRTAFFQPAMSGGCFKGVAAEGRTAGRVSK